jgi:hypothetical protein
MIEILYLPYYGAATMKYCAILLLILLPTLSFAGTARETKHLEMSADGIQSLAIDCGAGALKLRSETGLDAIRIIAEIEVESSSEADLRNIIDKQMVLKLAKQSDTAVLRCHLAKLPIRSREARINLSIRVPEKLHVKIKDGSGKITVSDLVGNLTIDDDSGGMIVKNIIGKVSIKDSSGDIVIEDVRGSVEIRDGSGEITVTSIKGNVSVSDGSGGITIQDIDGSVTVSDGSGRIEINQVTKNVFIREYGSGEMDIDGVKGKVTIRE